MAANDKIYPGSLERYRAIRAMREESDAQEGSSPNPSLMIAEELAGLAYILDGIRYSTRKS